MQLNNFFIFQNEIKLITKIYACILFHMKNKWVVRVCSKYNQFATQLHIFVIISSII